MAKNRIRPWDDDKYLRPVMQEDPLLYSFGGDDDIGEDELFINDKDAIAQCTSDLKIPADIEVAVASTPESDIDHEIPFKEYQANGLVHTDEGISSSKVVADKIQNVNKNYFGSYSSFGIHREMISDKVFELFSYICMHIFMYICVSVFIQTLSIQLVSFDAGTN